MFMGGGVGGGGGGGGEYKRHNSSYLHYRVLRLPVCLVQLSGSRGLPNGVRLMGAATGGQTGPRGCSQHLRAGRGLSQTLQTCL